MISLPRVVWDEGTISFKVLVSEESKPAHDEECRISRVMAERLIIDLTRALMLGEKE